LAGLTAPCCFAGLLVISVLDELDSVVRCIEAGAEDYLTPQSSSPVPPTRQSASCSIATRSSA
jgi:hypothetical protein